MIKVGFFRRVSAFVLVASIVISSLCVSVSAAQTIQQIDPRFWPLQEKWEAALATGDPNRIIPAGEAIINLFMGNADPDVKAAQFLQNRDIELNILDPVVLGVAEAYEDLNDIQNAAKAWKRAQAIVTAWEKYNNKTPDEFMHTLIANKIKFYDVNVDVYAETPGATGEISYHGAKFEPKNGVLYGETFPTSQVVSTRDSYASAQLFYVLFESENIKDFDWYLKPLSKKRDILEIAWNLKNEGESLGSVMWNRTKIEQTVDYLKGLGIPILLRFGAEMNVWEKPADPAQFISAFRLVAQIAHERAPNVAMVFSPNSIGAMGKTYNMFYPGDEYVDWVGISLYTAKYFLGDKNQPDETQAIYLTGKFANTVAQIAPLIEEYGSRKPIMISEGGAENYSLANSSDETAWAIPQMRLMYGALPIIYPQVKAMFYFNTVFSESGQIAYNRFTLSDNKTIDELYGSLTASPYFIKKGQKASTVSYKKLGSASVYANAVTLTAYAPYLTMSNVAVTYRIDGKWMGASAAAPHRQTFNLSSYADGAHTLTVEVTGSGQLLKTLKYNMVKTGAVIALQKA